MILGDNSPRNDLHYFQYTEVLNILEQLSLQTLVETK